MKKLLLSVAVIATMGLSSCGGEDKKGEKKEGTPAVATGPTVCDCNAEYEKNPEDLSKGCKDMQDKIKKELEAVTTEEEAMAIQARIEKEMAACN
jgi:hypothetical protein